MTPQGYFDSSGPEAEKAINVRIGNDVLGIGNYREHFYRPDLVKRILAGETINSTVTLATVKPPPAIVFNEAPGEAKTDEVTLRYTLTDRGGGIGDLNLIVNESAVQRLSSETHARNLKRKPDAANQRTGEITVKLGLGVNQIRLEAFNAGNTVASDPAEARILAKFQARKPKLHVLAIGIDAYDNPRLTLRYAAKDARAVSEAFKTGATGLFDSVDVTLLTTREQTSVGAIRKAFDKYRQVAADDVFVFYVGSHGSMEGETNVDRRYYLLTSSVGATSLDKIKQTAISQDELKRLIANIPAQKKLLLLDTCHSGAVADALLSRGMEEDAAIKSLSRAVGSTILTAATEAQLALEGHEGHGLFTWTLLDGLKGSADSKKRGFVNTNELADYVEDKMPEIAEKRFKARQIPYKNSIGQGFPVVSVGGARQ
ncbi:MAG: hypothetical protein A2040_19910 [Rhodocyclales bacterium GWA2_65_19]|nr:MAG: hypothetical protein A2040_19910 [Rhodocyclales bacterium GWA2_65_19]